METRRKSLFNSEIIFILQIFLILSSNVLCTDDCNDKNYDHLTVVTNDNQCIHTDDNQLESASNYDPVLSVTPSEIINLNELKSDSKSLDYLSMPSLESKTEINEKEIQLDENNEKIIDEEFIKQNINFNTIKESLLVDEIYENISVNLSTTEIPVSELHYQNENEIITTTNIIEIKNDDETIIKNQEDDEKLIDPINLSNENEIENKDDNLKASKLISNMELDDSLEVNSQQIQPSAFLYEATTIFNAKLNNNSSPNDTKLSDFEKYKNSSFNFGDLYEMCNGGSDCDLNTLPIRPSAQTQREKLRDTSSSIPEVSIQFADVPLGNGFQVDQLHLSEGTFLFDYLGDFLSWLQPNNFPIELIRDAIRNQISIYELLTESLKLEAGFIAVLVGGILLALAAPIVVLSHTCYRLRKRKGDDNFEETWSGNCRRRSLVFILQILIIFLLVGIVAIVVTNQQVGDGVLQTNHALQTILSDLDTFLGNSHLQLHFAVSKHLEQVVQAADADLNNVEVLLGQPIQVELSRETGVDVALDSLRNIAQDATKVSELVELVQLAAGLVGEGIILTRDKLSDLRLQVDSFRRQCATRDRSLCDTINVIGLDITTRIDIIRQDDKLKRIRQIGGPDLRSAVEAARILYRDIPRQVESDTKMERQDVRRQLNQKQIRVDENVRTLDTFFKNLRGKIIKSQNSVDDISSEIPELEFWRWSSGLGAVGLILLVWILLQSGISCGCCGSEKAAAPTLLISVLMICLVSTVLWLVSLVLLIIGGHGQVFICRPLYEEPEFPALSQLLDRPGLFQNPHNFLSTLTYGNDTMDVPLNKVLRDCEANRAIYPTFQLSGIFSVDKMAESRQWDPLQENIDKINVKLDHINLLSPNLYQQLDDLQQGLSVNLTAHRVQLSEPLMGKDLNAFAAQLDSVGNQLTDLATASRIETLATRTRRLIATHIDPLKEKKENLVYQLTALEVQLGPLHRQVEQSISHLKTIQFFINNQGNTIASKKSSEYRRRLISYLDQYRIHLTDKMNNDIAKCHPLWKLFHATRLMLCKNIMDPLNGFWFSIVWCLFLLLVATPICLKLVDYYRQKSHSCSSHLSGSPSENLMSNEQGKDWSSPNGSGDNGGGGGW